MTSSLAILQDIVKSKVQSWRQKKNCLKYLQDARDQFVTIESKLIAGTLLNASEQFIYDNNSGCDDEKIQWLQNEIKSMVTNSRLDSSEKKELLDNVTSNITALEEEAKSSSADSVKVLEKLKKAKERKAEIEKITPIKYNLRYHNELVKLRLEVNKLVELEQKGRNGALTLADLKKLEVKSDLENEIQTKEQSCKNWFQSEEDYSILCKLVMDEVSKRIDQSNNKSSSSSHSSSNNNKSSAKPAAAVKSDWTTVSTTKKPMSRNQAAALVNSRNGFSSAFQEDSD